MTTPTRMKRLAAAAALALSVLMLLMLPLQGLAALETEPPEGEPSSVSLAADPESEVLVSDPSETGEDTLTEDPGEEPGEEPAGEAGDVEADPAKDPEEKPGQPGEDEEPEDPEGEEVEEEEELSQAGDGLLVPAMARGVQGLLSGPLTGTPVEVTLNNDYDTVIAHTSGGLMQATSNGAPASIEFDPTASYVVLTGGPYSTSVVVDGTDMNGQQITVLMKDLSLEMTSFALQNGAKVNLLIMGENKINESFITVGMPGSAPQDMGGVHVPEDCSVTIGSVDGTDSHSLLVVGLSNGAGIGGGLNQASGAITINSGHITAMASDGRVGGTAGFGASGIGGGNYAPCTSITINGGTILAYGSGGAGIGSGYYYEFERSQVKENGSITINGGTITARTGGEGGIGGAAIGGGMGFNSGAILITGGTIDAGGGARSAGIGGGAGGSCDVTITGGDIFAWGVGAAGESAGIGTGKNEDLTEPLTGTVTITGGTIRAYGSSGGAGIGGGPGASCDVSISNATVTAVGGGSSAEKMVTSGGSPTGGGYGGGAGIGNGQPYLGVTVTSSTVIITGSAVVSAEGGLYSAAIGGATSYETDYANNGALVTITTDSDTVTITGGASVTAVGGLNAPGIGGGAEGNGAVLTIDSTASVTAYSNTNYAFQALNDENKGTALLENLYFATEPSRSAFPITGTGSSDSYVDGASATLTLPAVPTTHNSWKTADGYRAFGYTTAAAYQYHGSQEATTRWIARVSDDAFYIPPQAGAAEPQLVDFCLLAQYLPGQAGANATGMPAPDKAVIFDGDSHTVTSTVPTWTDYALTGWKTEDGTVHQAGEDIPVEGENLVLTAQWRSTLVDYSVRYTNAAGVSGVTGMPANTTVTERATYKVSSTVPQRSGYRFDGWKYNATTTVYQGGSTFTMPSADVTLTAQWTALPPPVEYLVTFDYNGAGPQQYQSVQAGGTATRPTTPSWNGYTFEGWYLGNALYSFSTPVNSDITLTARWSGQPQPQSYTVTYDFADGRPTQQRTVLEGALVPRIDDPTRGGYTFAGWRYNGTGWNFASDTMPAMNITLTANWTWNGDPPPEPEPSSSTPASSSSSSTITPASSSSAPSSSSSAASSSSSGGRTEPPVTSVPPATVDDPPAPTPTAPTDGAGTDGASAAVTNGGAPLPARAQAQIEAQTGNPITDILNGNVPLGGPSIAGAWGLLNLIMALLGLGGSLVLSILLIVRRSRGKRHAVITILALVPGLLTGIIFLLVDNLSSPMVFVNQWTLWLALVFVVHLVLVVLRLINQRRQDSEDEQDAMEDKAFDY